MSDFDHFTAVITGASQGIGAATARAFADRGATTILAARNAARLHDLAEEIGKLGGRAIPVPCDVASAADVARLIDTATRETGRLDLLVNNAGIIDPIARLEESDPDAWCGIVDVNLKGVYFGLRYALPVMAAQGNGTVINISSGAATSALEGWSHYCATKAGVLSLTRVADKEMRDKGVRVVGLSPGTVATQMQVQIRQSGINPVSALDPSVHIPPAAVAKAILWLLGPDADAHLGQDFSLKTPEGRAVIADMLVA